ncbi:hypothetical protein BC832DRAFT_46672 [Gaertneriomyces semiglobifer]|nr:hypothetical protein BC832DRAFT_46672 [Gaertneriomyces semiglobifer]
MGDCGERHGLLLNLLLVMSVLYNSQAFLFSLRAKVHLLNSSPIYIRLLSFLSFSSLWSFRRRCRRTSAACAHTHAAVNVVNCISSLPKLGLLRRPPHARTLHKCTRGVGHIQPTP